MQPLQPIEPSFLQELIAQGEGILAQPTETLLDLAQDPNTPRSLLEILVNQGDAAVADVARMHVNWAGELTDWQSEIDAIFRTIQLGQNDRLAVELLKLGPVPPEFMSAWVPANVLIQALKNPHMPLRYRLKLLERLAQEPTLEPRLQVAESPETPLAVLEQLVGDLELPVRLATQHNPACPPALVQLVEGHHAIASDWSTDAEQLAALGQSRWDWVRLAVAQNPLTSAEMLLQLANDAVFKIQLAVAKNPGTPEIVLAVLATHSDATVQAAIAVHPNATAEILLQVLPTQRSVILQQKNLPAIVLQQLFEDAIAQDPVKGVENIRYQLLRQPNTPETVLSSLSKYDVEAIRADLLANRHQPPSPEILENWVNDRIDYLADVACHPNVSVPILEQLAQCNNPKVQIKVAQTSLTPDYLKYQLLEDLSRNAEKRIVLQIASDPNTPVSILESIGQGELYATKFEREIRRILASEYPVKSDFYQTVEDRRMSLLKHNILSPSRLVVNVEHWMSVIQAPDLLAAVADDLNRMDTHQWFDRLAFRLAEILPELDESSLKQVAHELFEILRISSSRIQYNDPEREVSIALLGNPNTPLSHREALKLQLLKPDPSLRRHNRRFLIDDEKKDYKLLLALVNNSQVKETERQEYIRILMDDDFGRRLLAGDPRTSGSILEQLLETNQRDILEAITNNPSASESILRKIANQRQDYLWIKIAENPSAPAALLRQFMTENPEGMQVNSNVSRVDLVLKNPNFPTLERYRLLLSQDEAQETAKRPVRKLKQDKKRW